MKVSQNGGSISSDFKAEQAEIYVDEMHFTNVIFNLMDNAVKYKRDDVELHLTLRTWNTGDKINISIEDNGIGIQKDDLKRIFDKFYRVHTGNKHDVKGFGLGLAYVKKIVGIQNWGIYAESEYCYGTKFIITLPTIKKLELWKNNCEYYYARTMRAWACCCESIYRQRGMRRNCFRTEMPVTRPS